MRSFVKRVRHRDEDKVDMIDAAEGGDFLALVKLLVSAEGLTMRADETIGATFVS